MILIAPYTVLAENRTIAAVVKKCILQEDISARVILFGSRARGDAEEESDWDFLVLTKETDTELLAEKLRKVMLRKIELPHDTVVFLLVKNEKVWEDEYSVSDIYESISEEGILL